MPEIDEFENLAENIILNFVHHNTVVNGVGYDEKAVKSLAEALRNVAAKYEQIGYNKAVEDCENVAHEQAKSLRSLAPYNYELQEKIHICYQINDEIRRLKKG